MKIFIFIALSAYLAGTFGVFVPPRPGHKHLTGPKECAKGQSYWCQNLTIAADCHAVKHCIQSVWIYQQLPPDNSNVCQVCLDMVKQARDQLMSNDTQELIKEVFEGSCALLHLKPVVKECDKIADEYIPELIDTLASEMNPQVVCSVAGLCNSERVHRLLAESGEATEVDNPKAEVDSCTGCHTVVDLVESKFNKASRDDILQGFLEVCGKMSSFSDACSNIVITYFTEIYNHLRENLNSNEVCLMAGECSAQFHTHANVEITPISHVGYVDVENTKDDLPCELCEQLVQHLRDLLVAQTTKDEFKMVLEGLCKQTSKTFINECMGIVDEYYSVAYDFLVSELNNTVVCSMIGICPRKIGEVVPIAPLLSVETVEKNLEVVPSKKPVIKINMAKQNSLEEILITPEQAQLPIDRLVPMHQQLYNKEVCVFCEYFLHYVQQALTNPATEDQIKDVLDKACAKLPVSVNETCTQFVNTYEPALVAILAQEIDPSQVCPLIKACPGSNIRDVDIFMQHKPEADGKCPLCLFAVTRLEQMVKNQKTKEDIKHALSKLCSDLPNDLAAECDDFVSTYTDELVEMLIADLNPQEVCVYLHLCNDSKPASNVPKHVEQTLFGGDIETNVIPDNTVNGELHHTGENPECVLCEFVMKQIEDQLQNNKTDEAIKRAVHGVCKIMPKTISDECNQFVDQYADTIIQLLIATLEPSEICRMMKLCSAQIEAVREEVLECAVCEEMVKAVEKILNNPKADHAIDHVLEKACRALPEKYKSKCMHLGEKYGKTIIDLVKTLGNNPHVVCHEIGQCATKVKRPGDGILGMNQCTWGPSYWCINEENADHCGATKHCEERVWFQSRSKRQIGSNPCTYGPSYWCASQQNANRCGATKHCEERVWSQNRNKRQIGSNPCTYGPSYWCASQRNANRCGARSYCQRGARGKRQIGSDPCTYGPSYWCANPQNAEKCSVTKHCEERVWSQNRNKRQIGSNPCTYGPSYWCASQQNANRCGARSYCQRGARGKRQVGSTIPGSGPCTFGPSYWCVNPQNARRCNATKYCEERVWSKNRNKRQIGSNPCTYGPSYWCASQQNANRCGAVQHCTQKVWGSRRGKRDVIVGSDPCTYGPSYWCENEQNADKCGARKHCEEKVWSAGRPKRSPLTKVGENFCTAGPGYWCASEANADKCGTGARKHCEEKVWLGRRPKRQIGGDPCVWGPSHWCKSEENADKCGPEARKHCEEKVWSGRRPKRSPQRKVGENLCTAGPGYWCASEANADKCGTGARKHCEEKVWLGRRPKRQIGGNPCVWGPSHWCKSEENADKCGPGARKHCEEKVWSGRRPKRSPQTKVGENLCTAGPGYWCASEANADKCGTGARKHCEEKVWLGRRPKRQIGADPCVWGPSHWCQSEKNADKCGPGARKHCEEKVWLGRRPKRSPHTKVGENLCTAGPGYWCASEANADKCGAGARKHCEEKVWLGRRPKRQIGGNPCVWGPSHWCKSEENADKCGPGARKHCEEKVWFGTSPKN